MNPAEEGTGLGKENAAMGPEVERAAPADELAPQTGSLLNGMAVEMVKDDGALVSGVKAVWLVREPTKGDSRSSGTTSSEGPARQPAALTAVSVSC